MHQKMFLKALVLCLLTWITAADFGSFYLPITGNVYPQGNYYATISVDKSSQTYFLDIDTGSDLTWLQCDIQSPCTKCTPAPKSLYKPNGNILTCQDPICDCNKLKPPNAQCDYEVDYVDHGSSTGVLVRDHISLNMTNGTTVTTQLAFGCGYKQAVQNPNLQTYVDGVLGLGKGKPSILTQLQSMGVIRNVVGHCFSGQGGGYLLFGDGFPPNSGIVWKPMLSHSDHYSVGSADLKLGGKNTKIKDLYIVFDSGSTYTYFTSKAYNHLVSLLKADLNGKKLIAEPADKNLPVCWKGDTPFKSISDAAIYFKPLALSFTKETNVQFEMPPESYLIFTDKGNVCLGILDGTQHGLKTKNLIGDISMHDKLVIYDNERKQIGWGAANCSIIPKS